MNCNERETKKLHHNQSLFENLKFKLKKITIKIIKMNFD